MLTSAIGLGSHLHEELRDLDRELTHTPIYPPVLVERLLAVYRSMELHMDAEESEYLSEVLHQDPSRERAVRQLRNEHQRLTQQLRLLMEELDTLDIVTTEFSVRLTNWTDGVLRYLAREDAMVAEVSNREIGVDD